MMPCNYDAPTREETERERELERLSAKLRQERFKNDSPDFEENDTTSETWSTCTEISKRIKGLEESKIINDNTISQCFPKHPAELADYLITRHYRLEGALEALRELYNACPPWE